MQSERYWKYKFGSSASRKVEQSTINLVDELRTIHIQAAKNRAVNLHSGLPDLSRTTMAADAVAGDVVCNVAETVVLRPCGGPPAIRHIIG
jgi:hypothetical protein